MISPFFLELGLIVIVATVLGLVFSRLKQPIMLAYIATGILLGASFFKAIGNYELIGLFSEIGIAFLLYLIGLNMNIGALKEVGKASILVGTTQVAASSIIGFFAATMLGFPFIEAIYLGIAMAFSSTIIVVKLLSDKNELNTLHGRMSLGILLVQDFFAITALLLVASIGTRATLLQSISSFATSGIIFLGTAFIIGKYIIPRLFDAFAESQELLFLSGISWAFFLAGVANFFGFSIEAGAFVAGVTLSHLPYSFDISGKIRYVRDFFLVLFFVALGAKLATQSTAALFLPAIVFSALILIINPAIVAALTGFFGYKKRTRLLTALSAGTLSEFSLILMVLGEKAGHFGAALSSLATVVGVITITIATYFILNGEKIYMFASKKIGFSEKQGRGMHEKKIETVFLGFDKLGYSLFKAMHLNKESTFIVDINPHLAKALQKEQYDFHFGDATDANTIELLKSIQPKTIISTITEKDASNALLKEIALWRNKPNVVLTTGNSMHAMELYEMGASYVIVPEVLAGKKISETIQKIVKSRKEIEKERQSHIQELREMIEKKMS